MAPIHATDYLASPGSTVDLASLATLSRIAAHGKKALRAQLRKRVRRFGVLQEALYAESRQALLLIFQGMDAAGKDSTIKYVTTGVNPQGFRVSNFQRPTRKDIEHSYLRRHWLALPERGRIGIFNRSHYEEVVTLRVHPELLAQRKLPPQPAGPGFWRQRLVDIAAFEAHLAANGTAVAKFFLNVSKAEQKRRLLRRLNNPTKLWKFDAADLEARQRWDDYRRAYEAAFAATSTPNAPWYIVPADDKPAMRVIVASIIVETLAAMQPRYPAPDDAQRARVAAARAALGC